MKKTKVCLLILLLALALIGTGCSSSKEAVNTLASYDYWYFYDEVSGENELMRFTEEMEFIYRCECGEPVGDSDLLEKFDFDADSMMLHLYNDFDDFTMDVKVLSYNDYHLMLEMDDRIKTFTPYEISYPEAYYGEDNTYISDYEGYCSIFKIEDGKAEVGPFDYDGDTQYPEGTFLSVDLAQDVEIYDLTVNTKVQEDGSPKHTCTYKELSLKETAKLLEDCSSAAFIWYNDDLQIEKMLFWGQTIVS